MSQDLVQGWTEPIEYILKTRNLAIDLASKTVTIEVYTRAGVLKTMGGTLETVPAVLGKVSFAPDESDLLAIESPYRVRFKIEPDGYFVPNGPAEIWNVRR